MGFHLQFESRIRNRESVLIFHRIQPMRSLDSAIRDRVSAIPNRVSEIPDRVSGMSGSYVVLQMRSKYLKYLGFFRKKIWILEADIDKDSNR